MILPRALVPKHLHQLDYGKIAIARLIAASKPPTMTHLSGLFLRQTRKTRMSNGAKGAATRMGLKFAKLLTKMKEVR